MSPQAIITTTIFTLTIVGLLRFQNRPAAVFGVTFLSLITFGLVSKEQLITSIANPGLVTLILLIICSFAIEKTRALRTIAAKIIVPSYAKTFVRLFSTTAVCSAFLNNTAVVATLLSPIRNNPHHYASKLLLPLSYAAILGGTLTLIGTSTNLIVNSLYIDATGKSIDFFAFTAIGIMLVVVCGSILGFFVRYLPNTHQQTEGEQGYFIDAKVTSDSELIGKTVESNGLRHLESLFLVELVRDGRLISPVYPSETLQENDRLIFSGDITKLAQLQQFSGLETFAHQSDLKDSNLTEVVVRHESILVWRTLKQVGFRALFDAAVVAIRRDGEQVSGKLGEVKIKAGDFLVLAVGDDFKSRRNLSKNFILLSGVETETRLSGWRAWLATFGFAAMIVSASVGLIDLLEGLIILLGGLIFTQSLNVNEIIRRLPIDIWLVVSSAILLSHALVNAGVAESISTLANGAFSEQHVYLALIAVYLITWLMTELVTNNAAAALMFPIAYSLALGFGVDVMPFVMTVAFAASGSFVSPYGYQTNLMVYNSGNYRLGDFVKVGLPVSIVYGLIVIVSVPYFFPF
ncbi:SLC13 family permease [Shewanella sp. WXL01]|uniref:SLC13 family permease n=1 Tax=Shewanella maritima TaxID=2520507 RepID=A0A411PE83_9GAMM|nr:MULTISPECIES: SLC13 family permease [Shewanella]NKF50101.1 SLC13 family permease [Shewanella sp. WXL01]QBF81845.1 SLC13 family permease [Shewanella maritima]